MQKSGNTILITGGGSGIGRGLAEALHRQGNQIVIAGRRESVLAETTAANPGMRSLTLNIEDPGSFERFTADVKAQFPTLNVLINNAGIMQPEKLQEGVKTLPTAEATIATNLLGPLRLTAALLPVLQAQPTSTIINVTSGLAFVPMTATPTYSATKAALHSWTQSLRFQLRGTSVEVLELAPPYVQTELMGTRQLNDPYAMPLADYIAESVPLLANPPASGEILVERVRFLRFAEVDGSYEKVFEGMNNRAH